MIIKQKYKKGGKIPKMVKPKRNKLSQRRLKYKREQKEWMRQQRHKAWMAHQMIDDDLRNLHLNPVGKEENNEIQEKETEEK